MRRKKTINIFEYLDYRLFLLDYYNHKKSSTRDFTYRSFAQRASVAPSLLKDILSGRQNLTLATMQKYADAMSLTQKETAYFSMLVQFNNSKEDSSKNLLLGELVRLRGKSQVKMLSAKQYEYFSNWYHAVVREMVTEMGMGENPEAIAEAITPQITPHKVRKSIDLLKELDLIYQDESGTWRSRDKVISSESQVQSLSLKNYHKEMIEHGLQSIERFPSDKREIQGLTLSCSADLYEKIKLRMRSFTEEVLNMVADENTPAEKVFQLNLQLFPFSDDKNEVKS